MANAVVDVENLELENGINIFQSLSGIFPDAEPAFLERISIEYSLNSQNLNAFIEGLLQSKNYPKRKQPTPEPSLPHSVVDTSHRQSAEQFLTKFKDPAKYFKERNVGNGFADLSKLYLRDKFKFTSVKKINEALNLHNSNLTLTKHYLDTIRPDRCTKRGKFELLAYLPSANEEFLDEIYFLDHENEIAVLLYEGEELTRFRLEEAKINNELFECQCCFNDEVFNLDVATCTEGHIFCKACVKRSTEIAFGDGRTKFTCLSNCDGEFPLEILNGLLAEPLYKKIISKIQEEEVKSADISGICFCPYCEYAEVLPDTERLFRCRNCKKECCKLCRNEPHIPLSCKEYDDEKKKSGIRTQIEDKMTEALVRECYKCKKKFIKQDGCNKMLCVCGAVMCYVCREPVKDYSHFSDHIDRLAGHRQVEPSTSSGKKRCPLWSKNHELHVEAVIKAAEAATAEMELQNPGVHIESQQLLKGLKRKNKS